MCRCMCTELKRCRCVCIQHKKRRCSVSAKRWRCVCTKHKKKRCNVAYMFVRVALLTDGGGYLVICIPPSALLYNFITFAIVLSMRRVVCWWAFSFVLALVVFGICARVWQN